MDIYVNCVTFFVEVQVKNLGEVEEHGRIEQFTGKKLICHNESDSRGFALKSLTNLKIKETLEKLDESNKEKSKANEL